MLGVASLGGDTLIACQFQFQALPLVVVVPALPLQDSARQP